VTAWLDPLRWVLDAAGTPVPFFFRDDDAGWDDPALEALLDTFEPHGLPLDVAAIPTETTPQTARLLVGRRESGRNDVVVHQHGFAHVNHEPVGRKCEFGDSRGAEQQAADLSRGRSLLSELVGPLPAVFTPPWNRCAAWTPGVLHELGFRVLSRDLTAGRAEITGLVELPVTIDWFAKRKKVPIDRTARGELLGAAAASGQPVGVMLHHAVTSAAEREDVGALLRLVSTHAAARADHLDRLAAAAA